MAIRKDLRKQRRVPFLGAINVSWMDPSGQPTFTLCKCVDLSKSGMRIQSPMLIPVRDTVWIRSEHVGLSGMGRVRYCTRAVGKCIIGIELQPGFRMPKDVLSPP